MGGMELLTLVKANELAKLPGNEVWIVMTEDGGEPMIPLVNVKLVSLGVNYYQGDSGGYVHAMWAFHQKTKLHQKRLTALLNEIQPDVVVSTEQFEKLFLPTLKIHSRPAFVREMHMSKRYGLDGVASWPKKLKERMKYFQDYEWKIRAYDKIVAVTEEGKSGTWKNWDKVTIIPNPLMKRSTAVADGSAKVAITSGRLFRMKNFESLVNIWSKVVRRHPDWTLQIWGNGGEEARLKQQIERLGLQEKVFLMGYTSDMVGEMAKASLFVLTSKSESFSLVTLEAMSVGIPSVVYNCPGGIRYVVEDGKTGFLVPMGDEEAFVEKVCTLIEDTEMRKEMGAQALKVSEKYAMDKVIEQWMELFRDLCQKKKGNKQGSNL